MMNHSKLLLLTLLFSAMGLVACGGGDDRVTDSGVNPTTDASEMGGSCSDAPSGPYGSRVGARLENFTLPCCNCGERSNTSCSSTSDCAAGEACVAGSCGPTFSLYGEHSCDTKLTIISIAAGWCGPCRRESEQFTEYIWNDYRDRGVNLLQAVIQTEMRSAPDYSYCDSWVSEYDLQNVEFIDPEGYLQPVFPSGSLPSTVIIDNEGVIRFREDGASDGLTTLRAALDELLAEIDAENG